MSIIVKKHTNMNKKIIIYLFLFVPILMASCNLLGESEKNEDREIKTIEVFPDSVRKHIIEQDSLSRELISKIDTLTTELNNAKKEIEELHAGIKELKAPGRMALSSLIMSILAIILLIIRTNKKVDKWGVVDIVKPLIKEQTKGLEVRIKSAEKNIERVDKATSDAQSDPVTSSIKNRLMDIEIKVNKMAEATAAPANSYPSYTHSTIDSRESQVLEFPKTVYAKVNSNKYFVRIFDSKQEECVYTIKFTGQGEGEFDIISLDKIKSINDLKYVVELTPDSCLLEEATNYKVIEKGKCKKVEDKYWEVTKKLRIKVTK